MATYLENKAIQLRENKQRSPNASTEPVSSIEIHGRIQLLRHLSVNFVAVTRIVWFLLPA